MEGILRFKNGLGLTIKQLHCSTNSQWAYIWEGLLLEGVLRLRFGGLILWGGAYYWNFTVSILPPSMEDFLFSTPLPHPRGISSVASYFSSKCLAFTVQIQKPCTQQLKGFGEKML